MVYQLITYAMKKSIFKVMLGASIVVSAAVILIAYSCEKEAIVPNGSDVQPTFQRDMPIPNSLCGEIEKKSFKTENNREYGDAFLYNDKKFFYVELIAMPDILIQDVYVHVANKPDEIPVDINGNPDFTKFTYSITGKPLNDIRKLQIPLIDMRGESIITVMAYTKTLREGEKHGKLIRTWIEGRPYGSNGNGRLFVYEKDVCLENEVNAEEGM